MTLSNILDATYSSPRATRGMRHPLGGDTESEAQKLARDAWLRQRGPTEPPGGKAVARAMRVQAWEARGR